MPNSLTGNIARIADAKLDIVEICQRFGIVTEEEFSSIRIDELAERLGQISVHKNTSSTIGGEDNPNGISIPAGYYDNSNTIEIDPQIITELQKI